MTYVTTADAKDHLAIDQDLTIHDRRIAICIGAAEDWAENYTQRSLGELMQFNSPADSDQTAQATPVDSPGYFGVPWNPLYPAPNYLAIDQQLWTVQNWQHYWGHNPNPIANDHSNPLRRDVYAAILLYMESLFDRNTDNLKLLQDTAMGMLSPYRIAMGVA